MGNAFKVPFLYTFYTCCIPKDLELIDSELGKEKRWERTTIVRDATSSNVVDKFQFKSLMSISEEVNLFGNKRLKNLQPDHWKYNRLIHWTVCGLWLFKGPSKIYGVPGPDLRTWGLKVFLAVKKEEQKLFFDERNVGSSEIFLRLSLPVERKTPPEGFRWDIVWFRWKPASTGMPPEATEYHRKLFRCKNSVSSEF